MLTMEGEYVGIKVTEPIRKENTEKEGAVLTLPGMGIQICRRRGTALTMYDRDNAPGGRANDIQWDITEIRSRTGSEDGAILIQKERPGIGENQ